MISARHEDLLKKVTVRIKTKIINGTLILGSGVIFYSKKDDYSTIITAKHCLLGRDFQYKVSQIEKISIQYKYLNEHDFREFNTTKENVIIDNERDISLIVIPNNELKSLLVLEQLPVILLSDSPRFSNYTSNGYPSAFQNSNAYHVLHSEYSTDQGAKFEVKSNSPLPPRTGEKAITALQGYSGAGLFIENLNFLCGLVIELKSIDGQFDTLICLKIDGLNQLLKGNQFGISNFNYHEIPNFKEVIDVSTRNFVDKYYAENISISSQRRTISIDLNLEGQIDEFNLPPFGEKFSKRSTLISEILKSLKNKPWQHFYGVIGFGKTQLANLIARQFDGEVIWVRAKEDNNLTLKIENAISKRHDAQITTSILIVFDGLPRLIGTENEINFFSKISKLITANKVNVITTSNHRISNRIIEYLKDNILEENLVPPLNIEEIIELLSLNGASDTIVDKYKNIVKFQSQGHPHFANEIIRFLKLKNWSTSEGDLNAIFNYDFSVELLQGIQLDLTRSLPDENARNLLYRLNAIRGSFGLDEVEIVAKIKPQILQPIEKLNLIKDIWIQQDSEVSYISSPLLNIFKLRNLSDELFTEINLAIGKYILAKGQMNQYDATRVINYFIAAKANNDAAFVLVLVLKELVEKPKYFYDSLFYIFWYFKEIPNDVDLNIKIYLRILQLNIAVGAGENKDIIFLLEDLELIVDKATLLGLDTSHAKIFLFLFYGKSDFERTNKYFLPVLDYFYKHDSVEQTEGLFQGLNSSAVLSWLPLIHVNNTTDIIQWLKNFSKLPKEQKDKARVSKDKTIPIFKAFGTIYENEKSKKTEEQQWDLVLEDLSKIINLAHQISLPLVFAYATRIKIWILSLHPNKNNVHSTLRSDEIITVRKSCFVTFLEWVKSYFNRKPRNSFLKAKSPINIVEESVKEISQNLDGKFILYDALAKGLDDVGNIDTAKKYYKKALEIKVELVLFEKIDTLILYSKLIFESNPKESLVYSQKALNLTLEDKEILFITKIKVIGYHAINQWCNDKKKESIYTLEKGYDLLFKTDKEDEFWKSALLKYGHAFHYFALIYTTGNAPEKDINGNPYLAPTKVHFDSKFSKEELEIYYFTERRFMNIWTIVKYFEDLEDYSMSKKWAEYLINECQINEPKYFQVIRIELSPYYIIKNEIIAALRNCYKQWEFHKNTSKEKLLEETTQPFLSRLVKNRPVSSNGKFISIALGSVVLVAVIKVLNDYINGKNNIEDLLNDIKIWAQTEEIDKEWQPVIELLSLATNDLKDYLKIYNYIKEYKGENQETLFSIAYLLSSIHAPLKEAFQLHLHIFPVLVQILNLAKGSIPFLVVPFFENFWEHKFEENKSQFDSPKFWTDKSYPRFKNAKFNNKLKYLVQALSHHSGIDLTPKQDDWINH